MPIAIIEILNFGYIQDDGFGVFVPNVGGYHVQIGESE